MMVRMGVLVVLWVVVHVMIMVFVRVVKVWGMWFEVVAVCLNVVMGGSFMVVRNVMMGMLPTVMAALLLVLWRIIICAMEYLRSAGKLPLNPALPPVVMVRWRALRPVMMLTPPIMTDVQEAVSGRQASAVKAVLPCAHNRPEGSPW
jgi:hypothetical protein